MDNTLAGIQSELVDEVVLGAMALMTENEVGEAVPAAAQSEDDITVAVYCDENQQSAVILRCSQPLARDLTAKMLELDPGDITDVDLLDATGELVNVIAGNLRGVVDSPGKMSAPFALGEEAFAWLEQAVSNAYRFAGLPLQVLRV